MAVDESIKATRCKTGSTAGCRTDRNRCMTHDLWSSLNVHMVEFLNSISLQKLVDEQLAKGLMVEDKPSVKRAISAMPVKQLVRVNAPNSVFALGNAFSKN